jgi:hypothetical protein
MNDHARNPSSDRIAQNEREPRSSPALSVATARDGDDLVRAAFDRLGHTDDPQALLQAMVRVGEELDPKTEPMRRIVQKLAVGAIECQILARARILHALWPQPEAALAYRTIAGKVVGIPDADIERAAEMLGDAVGHACAEAAEAIGPKFDHETWAYVLLEVLVPQELGRGDNVVDLRAVRLGRL